jgi:TolB protein
MITRVLLGLAAALAAWAPAAAQQPMPVIAIPPLSTPDDKPTGGGQTTLGLAWSASQLIASDLRSTGEMMALPPDQKDYYSYPEVTAPSYPKWRAAGVKALLTGFVQARPDGRLAVGCYVYDVERRRELGRIGFVVAADEWRRAAHKCSGLAYEKLTGAPGVFDTRIAYVASSPAGGTLVKRIAVMDSDGLEHEYMTPGAGEVLTPRLSPNGSRLAFVSFTGGKPHVRVMDLASGAHQPLVAGGDAMTFAPAFSPDGNRIAFTMTTAGNSDIFVQDVAGGFPRRLTSVPGIDTSPSFSPDGEHILFESDRSGTQQLYVMNADGSDQRRVSFGGGWYAAPAWSPDGERIAFTWRGSDGLRVGTMKLDGSDERLLTSGPRDEGPQWAASSRELIFQRTDAGGRSGIYRIALSGGQPRRVVTPQAASDPDWSGVRD